MTAEQMIDNYISEKFDKGDALTGKQVATLKPKQHIFFDGKKAVVIAVNVDKKRRETELVYVKGRRAFGKEISVIIPHNDVRSYVQAAIADED